MAASDDSGKRPSQVDERRSRFDEIAAHAIEFASRGRFLVIVSAVLAAWIAFGWHVRYDTRWLEAGAAGIAWMTLLLVFAVENANKRRDQALQQKLNTIAAALAESMDSADVPAEHVAELRAAVGLEGRESTG
jgi:low affinity Fe/Cu permease